MSFVRTLAQVRRLYPNLNADDARDIAHEWMAEAAAFRAEQPDTDCIQDHMPLEYFTERGDA